MFKELKSFFRVLFLVFNFAVFTNVEAQYKVNIEIKNSLNNFISDSYIFIKGKDKERILISNKEGKTTVNLAQGSYTIRVSHISYETYTNKFFIQKDTTLNILLKDKLENLQEVVLTAKETSKFTATSVIKKTAMEHLQPSSFTDLLSLLPGGTTSAPVLNVTNHIRLREAGILSNDYSTSSLGTLFVIDDVPLNTDANMQKTVGYQMIITPSSGYVDSRRNSTRRGVDMRSISTDDIKQVEIVRGIPSVKYGDLTSGLVKIERKKGYTQWNSRLKADGFSKLFYIGKGFDFSKSRIKLNLGLDYLNAKPDPRNDFENYKRYTASLRLEKEFLMGSETVTWGSNLDYTGTVDKEKSNPDVGFKKYESYTSSYRKIRFSNFVNIDFEDVLIKNINLRASYSNSSDQINQTKWVQIPSASALPVSTIAGEHYGIYVKPAYVSKLLIDGNPIDFYANLSSNLTFNTIGIKNNFLIGTEYTYSKNKGKGQVYDLKQPPSPSMATRPRAFKDIPSLQKWSFYLENKIKTNVKEIGFILRAGLRGTSFLALNKSYEMGNKIYLSPRLNAKLKFPDINIYKKPLKINLIAGWGRHFKTPTQSMLYPQNLFYDYVQLNYYHNNKDFRRVHFKTYVFSPVNQNITPAINNKKEISLNLNYDYNNLSITYFEEEMNSGFRQMSNFSPITYKKYDTSAIDHNAITQAPEVSQLPFEMQNAMALFSKETNGSSIRKKGIEFQFSGKRLKTINTRFTVNGAWFKTYYFNSLPVYKFPRKMMVNGKKHYNLGIYKDEDSYIREQFTTTLIADSYIPLLGLKTSLTGNFNWYYSKKQAPQNGMPTHYVDESGNIRKYGDAELKDPILKRLFIDYKNKNTERRTPFSANLHLKISKDFYEKITLSMYVNKLFNFYKDYYVNGVKIERKGLVSPYFGMEMNIKL